MATNPAAVMPDLSLTPALLPPPGVKPDFVNTPGSLKHTIYATATVCLAVSVLCLSVRLYTKARIMKRLEVEDYACFLSGLLYFSYVGLALASTAVYNAGAHQWDVSILEAMNFAQLANISEILYMPAMFLVKFSILKSFINIFVPNSKSISYVVLWTMIWLNLCFFTSLFFVQIFQCVPREAIWNPFVKGTCVNINSSFIASAAINVGSDITILLFPTITIWNLQMSTARKIPAIVVFATGVFACVCSIMRLVTSISALSNPDQSYALTSVALWASGELASGLVVSCLPYVPRLLGHAKPKIIHSYYSLFRTVTNRSPRNTSRNVKDLDEDRTPKRSGEDDYDHELEERQVSTRNLVSTTETSHTGQP